MIFVLLDFSVGVLQGLCLKWRFAYQQGVENATDGPDVYFVAVTSLAKNLGCNVVRGSAEGSLSLTVKFDVRGQTEIADFDLKIKTTGFW